MHELESTWSKRLLDRSCAAFSLTLGSECQNSGADCWHSPPGASRLWASVSCRNRLTKSYPRSLEQAEALRWTIDTTRLTLTAVSPTSVQPGAGGAIHPLGENRRVPPDLSADPGDCPGSQLTYEPTCKHRSGMHALDKAWEPLREAWTPTLTLYSIHFQI